MDMIAGLQTCIYACSMIATLSVFRAHVRMSETWKIQRLRGETRRIKTTNNGFNYKYSYKIWQILKNKKIK